MRSLKLTLLAIAAPVGACVAESHRESPIEPPPGYNFAYLAPDGAQVGLVQAFDDGSRTYLEFEHPTLELAIRTPSSDEPLPFHIEDRYVRLEGVYARMLLTADHASAALINEGAAPESARSAAAARWHEPPAPPPVDRVEEAATPLLAHVGVPEGLQTMSAQLRVSELNREIGALEERVRDLTRALAEAQRAGGASNLSVRDDRIPARFVIHFEDERAEARIDDDLLAPLGAAARAANRIYLHGHTDAYVASNRGGDLAIRRAVAVRKLLLAQNVSPERVRLFYRGAGSFVANNSTLEGKARNRRVEIEFRRW